MSPKYEYKFERVGGGAHQVSPRASKDYQKVIVKHAKDGWELVQVFAPSIGFNSYPKYFDVIMKKEETEE
jgi:hypothetical protein